ncbi:PTS cellobiose transporter subunit IIC [Clostridium isatidis]|uniref:Permease IIC component n=1 Tax=Clostridium isatidis TaxID=182773 RepID=A0A343JA45_9CLOT|nr:PTS cellobiose transporter subunit IIC [Clostridium isatidis]ASW42403.1 PTS system, cellobiose-specific IIC component [Clostridium isatidis]
MSKLNNLIENRLLPVAGKLGTSRILTVLRDAFMLAFPITVVGSLALVIMNIPYLDKVIGEEALTALKNVLGILPSATMSITTLFVVMAIGYYYAKSYDVDPIFPAVISIVSFLILTPLTVTTEAGELVNDIIPIARLGAKGMFVGIFASFLVTRLYILILSKDWTIKMPEGVPPTVAKSFASLIPTVIVLLSVVIVRTIFTFTPWGNIHDFIYEIIQMPLTSLGSGLVATLAAIFSVQILWFFGLHGQIIVNSVLDPIWNTLSLDNYEAFKANVELPNIITKQFMETFTVGIGGSGMTLAVIVGIFVIAKSKQLRQIAKLSAPSGIFNVNEPVIFGLPIVMNPTILIPWVLAPMAAVTVAYFAMKLGLVPLTTGVTVPWTVPIFFSGILATNSIRGGILQLVILAIVLAIWAPFIKVMDTQALKLEEELEENK